MTMQLTTDQARALLALSRGRAEHEVLPCDLSILDSDLFILDDESCPILSDDGLKLLESVPDVLDALSIQSYVDSAAKTAIYPERGTRVGLMYVQAGLLGECGELCGKLKKVMRDSDFELDARHRAQLDSELGDILWYIAMLCDELQVSLPSLLRADSFLELDVLGWYRPREKQEYVLSLIGLAKRVMQFATELVDTGDPREDPMFLEGETLVLFRKLIRIRVCALVMALIGFATSAGLTLDRAAAHNLDKLASRQARGVLRGDGDDR